VASFDTLTEPWIPVIRTDGTADELGLRDVLEQAPELREIRDPMPTVEFGLYRLLVALVMDVHRVKLLGDLEGLLDAGRFDGDGIASYCGKWHDRLDLFHPAHPVLQTAGMDTDDEKPLAELLPAVPSGTNALHFHHHGEDSFAACPAAAPRLLTSLAPFAT
jgi:CRISPR system Cascade subunit CasA